jgi:hypothetical protein
MESLRLAVYHRVDLRVQLTFESSRMPVGLSPGEPECTLFCVKDVKSRVSVRPAQS